MSRTEKSENVQNICKYISAPMYQLLHTIKLSEWYNDQKKQKQLFNAQ